MSDSSPDAPPERNSPFVLVDLRSGRAHPLQFGANVIGRSSKCHIVLDNEAISRRHAVLTVPEAGPCEIRDRFSRNGVHLDGGQIRGTASLLPGAFIQIWDFYLYFTRTDTRSPPFSFVDEVLEFVVWNATYACWHFGIAFGADWFVPAVYSPTDRTPPERPPTAAPEWDALRACFRQVKAREAAARALVAAQSSSIGNRYRLKLAPVLFTPTGATLVYEEFLSGAYCVTLSRAGTFLSGPAWVPDEINGDDD